MYQENDALTYVLILQRRIFMGELLVYKCNICGYVLEVIDLGKRQLIESGSGFSRSITVADATLICCGKQMTLLKPNSSNASAEKHKPIISFDGNKVTVKVGLTAHPMTTEHYIKCIEILYGDRTQRITLEPGDAPEATFFIGNETRVKAYAYCNLHELWFSEASK